MTSRKRAVFLALSGFLAASAMAGEAQAQRVSRITGKALGSLCSRKATENICDGYLAGVMDSAVWAHEFAALEHADAPQGFCVPTEQRTAQIRSVVVAWLQAHNDALAQPAGKAVYRALHENYPCRSTVAPATREGGK